MKFAKKKQLNTFVIFECTFILLFSSNDINCYVDAVLNIHIEYAQLSTRNTTNVTYLTDFSRARFARAYCFPISCY